MTKSALFTLSLPKSRFIYHTKKSIWREFINTEQAQVRPSHFMFTFDWLGYLFCIAHLALVA
ncbi:hypothetical protein [Vibrio hibernica]|uniref:hypothetical protein n=1 Tax=Vibrio hibernica TaxID=2587465 RepID=UPI00187FAF8F|nr:hypothetical protein [Vibrio hibernica]